MYSRIVPLTFLYISSLLTVAATAKADIVWENNYDRARVKSIATGKPLFVDVYTDWCGWCKKLDSTVYPDPRVQQLARSFVMVRVNAEAEGVPFARMMRVTGYPTLFFATTQGAQVARVGYVEPGDFAAFMEETLRRNGPIRPQRAIPTLRSQPKNVASTSKSNQRRTGTRTASSSSNWKAQPEIRRAVDSSGYRGAFVLGDGGLKVVDTPNPKTCKSQSVQKKGASSRR